MSLETEYRRLPISDDREKESENENENKKDNIFLKEASLQSVFTTLHITSLIIHLVNGLYGLGINVFTFNYLKHDAKLKFSLLSLSYEQNSITSIISESASESSSPSIETNQCFVDQIGEYQVTPFFDCWWKWDGVFVITICEFITAFFHLLYILENTIVLLGWPKSHWSYLGYHSLRWVEYGITATLYSVATIIGTGTRDINAFFIACLAGFCLQICGMIMEFARSSLDIIHDFSPNINLEAKKQLKSALRASLGISFTVGMFLQVALFIPIIIGISSGNDDDSSSTFEKETNNIFFIQSIAYISGYFLFPIIAVLYAFKRIWFITAEILYCVCSVSVKTAMFWLTLSTIKMFYFAVQTENTISPKISDAAIRKVRDDWEIIRLWVGLIVPCVYLILLCVACISFTFKSHKQSYNARLLAIKSD